ncbi:YhfC family glutamic-type intramembrane protease [Thermaerobacter litoralis]
MEEQLRGIALAYGAAGAGAILLPALLFLAGYRRWGWRGRIALTGAATFLIFQGLLRLPWLPAFNQWATDRWGTAAAALLASLSAGLWEETGRYVAYRLVVRRPRLAEATAMGLGHGGFEAVMVGLSLVVTGVTLLALPPAGAASGGSGVWGIPGALPAEAEAALRQAQQAILAGGIGTPVLALVERIGALGLHIGLSVLVAAAWVRGRAVLWLAAVGIHFAANAAAVTLAQMGQAVAAEAVALILAALTLLVALRWGPVLDAAAAGLRGGTGGAEAEAAR